MSVYQQLGVKRVVNAMGHMTLLGGSILAREVLDAMVEANTCYVDMKELLEQAGKVVAEITGAEAGHVTSGTAAALVLATAACMTGKDREKIERLPNTDGMKNEVIIQKRLRMKYDRCVTIPGAKLVEVGDEMGTTQEQLEAAINRRTAAIHSLATAVREGVVPIGEVVSIGKKHGVPIIVDAAGQTYPIENLRKYTTIGADLVCYGGKYFGAPNSTGIVCGRKDLVEAAALQGFIGFEASGYRTLGRAMKVDRQEVVAVVVALRRWVSMDHESRFKVCDSRGKRIITGLKGVDGVELTPILGGTGLAVGVRVTLSAEKLGVKAESLAQKLRGGDPSIWLSFHENTLSLYTGTLVDGDEKILVDRLRELLTA